MSITVIELLTDALQEINAIDAFSAPAPEQGVRALRRLNQMMADWERQGIRMGWYPQTDMSATVPIRAEDELGVTKNLALTLCQGYGVEPTAMLVTEAGEYFAALSKRYLQYFEADMTQLPTADGAYLYPTPYCN